VRTLTDSEKPKPQVYDTRDITTRVVHIDRGTYRTRPPGSLGRGVYALCFVALAVAGFALAFSLAYLSSDAWPVIVQLVVVVAFAAGLLLLVANALWMIITGFVLANASVGVIVGGRAFHLAADSNFVQHLQMMGAMLIICLFAIAGAIIQRRLRFVITTGRLRYAYLALFGLMILLEVLVFTGVIAVDPQVFFYSCVLGTDLVVALTAGNNARYDPRTLDRMFYRAGMLSSSMFVAIALYATILLG
jgi:hypothetical protein